MQDEKQCEVRAWMKKAEDDLRTARVVMNAEPPFAWEFRYPGSNETPPAEYAYDAIQDV